MHERAARIVPGGAIAGDVGLIPGLQTADEERAGRGPEQPRHGEQESRPPRRHTPILSDRARAFSVSVEGRSLVLAPGGAGVHAVRWDAPAARRSNEVAGTVFVERARLDRKGDP